MIELELQDAKWSQKAAEQEAKLRADLAERLRLEMTARHNREYNSHTAEAPALAAQLRARATAAREAERKARKAETDAIYGVTSAAAPQCASVPDAPQSDAPVDAQPPEKVPSDGGATHAAETECIPTIAEILGVVDVDDGEELS